jgi:fumarate reductase flavoprotein subunit
MKQVEADVVVVAAGTAGLAAAVTAAENGASVIAFEKASTTGGAGNMARGPFAIESRIQRLRKIPLTREQAFNIHMDFTHWRVDARLVSTYINKSASTIDWLEGLGVEFIDVQSHNYGCNFSWLITKGPSTRREQPEAAIAIMKTLTDRAQALGVKFFFRTPAKKILKEGGRITGVIAEDDSGEEIRAKAKAVIVATGGFGDNPEMIKKYGGLEVEAGRSRVPGVTGDGLRMAWEVGAAQSEIIVQGGSGIAGIQEFIEVSFTLGQPNLMVNIQGERFMDEVIRQTTPFGGNAVAIQKDRTAIVIFDEDTKKYYEEEGLDFPPGVLVAEPILKITNFDAELKQIFDRGIKDIFVVDSLEELASKAGIDQDNLMKTVAEYNKACDTGRDEVFHKDPRYLRPVRRPKFYAAKMTPSGGMASSLGGIKINYKTEVVDKNFDVIPGLYAAGLDANSIYGDTYIMFLPGNTLGFALNSGRMAGENAAEYVKSLGK